MVADALPAKVKRRVATIQARTPDGIRLQLTDGDTVVWGSAADSPLKAEVLTALLKQPATTYDVSAPHYPAVR
jgi:cell division protein FtsQ